MGFQHFHAVTKQHNIVSPGFSEGLEHRKLGWGKRGPSHSFVDIQIATHNYSREGERLTHLAM